MTLTSNLSFPYFGLLGALQRGRPLWLFGAGAAVFLELFSVLYFQKHLSLKPCLYCVYIREASLLMALGALIAAIYPSLGFFRLLGYLGTMGGAILALVYCFKLEALNVAAKYWPTAYESCGSRAEFDLGRYLALKWPTHFLPAGPCGFDSNWSFLNLNMAEILIVVYLLALIGLLLSLGTNFLPKNPKNA
jgi:disulfide bond formation protein DsbB